MLLPQVATEVRDRRCFQGSRHRHGDKLEVGGQEGPQEGGKLGVTPGSVLTWDMGPRKRKCHSRGSAVTLRGRLQVRDEELWCSREYLLELAAEISVSLFLSQGIIM